MHEEFLPVQQDLQEQELLASVQGEVGAVTVEVEHALNYPLQELEAVPCPLAATDMFEVMEQVGRREVRRNNRIFKC